MKILGIDHIAIAVNNLDNSFARFARAFNLKLEGTEVLPERHLKIGFFSMGNTHIELVEPTSEEAAISKFLTNRGEGIHHFCVQVDNIEEALAHFKNIGYELIDKEPRAGAGGSKIAFVHPKSFGGVLIELKQNN